MSYREQKLLCEFEAEPAEFCKRKAPDRAPEKKSVGRGASIELSGGVAARNQSSAATSQVYARANSADQGSGGARHKLRTDRFNHWGDRGLAESDVLEAGDQLTTTES